jgi:hypothetical protein
MLYKQGFLGFENQVYPCLYTTLVVAFFEKKHLPKMLYKQGSTQNQPPLYPCLYNILVVIILENT